MTWKTFYTCEIVLLLRALLLSPQVFLTSIFGYKADMGNECEWHSPFTFTFTFMNVNPILFFFANECECECELIFAKWMWMWIDFFQFIYFSPFLVKNVKRKGKNDKNFRKMSFDDDRCFKFFHHSDLIMIKLWVFPIMD